MGAPAVVAITAITLVTGATLALTIRIRRREAKDEQALAASRERNLHIPQSLHPVIDPEICIGSYSCLRACPEGDILGIVDGKASLITAANCIGHGRCALECPVGAIRLVFGTSERGVDLPEVDADFESSRSGVHVVGELGGMGLIRNAITQGLEVAEALALRLNGWAGGSNGAVDVAIVGAGPAGLATALGCRRHGLSFQVLEQDTVTGAIAHYPRQKLVMTETVQLPFYGRFGKRLISKEELIRSWHKAMSKADLTVYEGVKVTAIEGADGDFTVRGGELSVRARKVVLATGRRGSPRKLGVPGEQLKKVTYRLIEPEQYAGSKVLVVGGGDAALESCIALAEETDAEVTLSYRNAALARCREANRSRIEQLIRSGRINALLPSEVRRIEADRVVLSAGERRAELANDYVIVNVGGELPAEFLHSVGVGMKRYHGEAPVARLARAGPKGPSAHPAAARQEVRRRRKLAVVLAVAGALIIAGLAAVGWDYYLLPEAERAKHPEHLRLRSAGDWGHGVGIAATLFMISNFLYALRKRWKRLKGNASIRRWLTVHMFVGFMSPLVIAFHAAFQPRSLVATGTAAALLIVVSTGVIGRFIYGLVPSEQGRTLELAELSGTWERLKGEISPLLRGVSERNAVRAVLSEATAPPPRGSLFSLILAMPVRGACDAFRLRRLRPLFPSAEQHREFAATFRRLGRIRTQVGFYKSLKRLLSVWRVLHVVLAVFLVVVIAAHIGVSLYLGYGWLLF